jgi:hypothetical protein
MKKFIVSLFFVITFSCIQAQQSSIEKNIIRDFAVNFFYKYKYQKNQNLRAWAYYTGNKLGYGQVDIEIAVEQIEVNNQFRDELFRTFIRFSNSDEELLIINLISIGMQATNARKLGKYISQNYKADGTVSAEINKPGEKKLNKFNIVDKEAKYIGGDVAYRKYINDNLYYPDSALKNNVSGIVEVQFTVDVDGSIVDTRIVAGGDLGYGLPEEAIRVIRSMPKWEPAILKGKPLKSVQKQRLTFRAPDSEVADSSHNQAKAIFKRSLFSGTKIFCDSLQYWSYQITILQETIILTLYAGNNNTNYKDKSKPIEVINGTIKGGLIITKDAPEYLVNRFKYENGILYEVNNEGGYNDYKECTGRSRK